MRSPRTTFPALMLALVALAVAGCGGSEVEPDEVPGNPPALTVPSDGDIGSGGAASNSGSTSDSSDSSASGSGSTGSTDTGTTTGSTGGTTAPTTTAPSTTDGTSGGTAAPTTPSTTDDTATNDQAPPAGSDAQQFENFCEQNAGAC
jgi:hypothetical protein